MPAYGTDADLPSQIAALEADGKWAEAGRMKRQLQTQLRTQTTASIENRESDTDSGIREQIAAAESRSVDARQEASSLSVEAQSIGQRMREAEERKDTVTASRLAAERADLLEHSKALQAESAQQVVAAGRLKRELVRERSVATEGRRQEELARHQAELPAMGATGNATVAAVRSVIEKGQRNEPIRKLY